MSLARVPVFPLQTVLYPGIRLPLRVFEPRYHRMLDDLYASGEEHPVFAVALTDDPEVGVPATPRRVGCLARVLQVSPPAEERFLLVEGTTRYLQHALHREREYAEADVAPLPEDAGAGADAVARLLREALAPHVLDLEQATPELPDEPCSLSYVVAHALPLDLAARQLLLEAPDAAARLALEARILHRLAPALRARALARKAHLN